MKHRVVADAGAVINDRVGEKPDPVAQDDVFTDNHVGANRHFRSQLRRRRDDRRGMNARRRPRRPVKPASHPGKGQVGVRCTDDRAGQPFRGNTLTDDDRGGACCPGFGRVAWVRQKGKLCGPGFVEAGHARDDGPGRVGCALHRVAKGSRKVTKSGRGWKVVHGAGGAPSGLTTSSSK